MPVTWKAPGNVLDLLDKIKIKHHHPRLELANFAVVFNESKPFVKNRFNFGSVSKFSPFNQLFQSPEKKDFSIVLCSDVWHSMLNSHQQEAILDLHLTRCEVEYVPEIVIEGKKKKVVKDEWGRVKYTDEVKYDEEGVPKWVIAPLDLSVFSRNVERFGLWCQDLLDMRQVMDLVAVPKDET